MPDVALTETPLDLMDANTVDLEGNALNLETDVNYTAQAELPAGGGGSEYQATSGPFVHMDDKAAITAIGRTRGRKIRHLETVRVKAGDTGNLWAWVSSGTGILNIFVEP